MTLPVCPACGVLAPDDRALCTLCATSFPEPRPEAPEAEGERRWVCVRTRFKCNACAQLSPVRGFSDDDILTCQLCGQRQGFPDGELRDVLEIAHATVDPGLRDFQVFERLEGKATFIDYARDKLSILAAPGHPRCGRCHAFVQLVRADGETCELTCDCGPQVHHVPRVLGGRLAELRGVYSDETRNDVPRAATANTSGTTALSCAHCGGAFAAGTLGSSPVVACTYCKAANRVDVPLGPKADPVWLLVEGASKKRREHVEAEERRENRLPNAVSALVKVLADEETDPATSRGWMVQVATFVFSGLVIFGIAAWNEVSSYLEYRSRAAMVQTTCTIERIDDTEKGDSVIRTYVGTVLDARTKTRQPIRAASDHKIWAAGAGKVEDLGWGGLRASTGQPCYFDPAHGRVVFNRPTTFAVWPMILLVLGFVASLAAGVLFGRRFLRELP